MDMQFAFVGLVVLVTGGSVGFVVWWCWARPRPTRNDSQCERCGREIELLVPVRMVNESTGGPSYEVLVCEECVEALRSAARICRHCARRAAYVGRNKQGSDVYRCTAGHLMIFRHGAISAYGRAADRRERRAQ
ncbi:MAG TPA: hypothetical protein VF458_19315 [Ktedonobacteraceae bacterium]